MGLKVPQTHGIPWCDLAVSTLRNIYRIKATRNACDKVKDHVSHTQPRKWHLDAGVIESSGLG